MKISFGSKIFDGPWGGGNFFLINLKNFLESNGHKVVFDLCHDDIDIILFTDPRPKNYSTSTISYKDIYQYKKYVNKNVVVIQRINECDERKGTTGINDLYLKSSNIADKVVFVSTWLMEIYLNLGLPIKKCTVILSGSDENIFNSHNRSIRKENEKFKVVTHHWSNNYFKGYKIYDYFDKLLNQEYWKNRYEFTFIGNISEDYNFENTKILKPLSGLNLAKEIKNHHIYLTASINEPSGNHHIEAAQCGLPILYLKSGGMPEYCDGYGVGFSNNFEEKLLKLTEDYKKYQNKMKDYPRNAYKTNLEFLELFNSHYKRISNKKENKFFQIFFLFKFKLSKIITFKIKSKFVRLYSKIKSYL